LISAAVAADAAAADFVVKMHMMTLLLFDGAVERRRAVVD
jgi:hypothetical protein